METQIALRFLVHHVSGQYGAEIITDVVRLTKPATSVFVSRNGKDEVPEGSIFS